MRLEKIASVLLIPVLCWAVITGMYFGSAKTASAAAAATDTCASSTVTNYNAFNAIATRGFKFDEAANTCTFSTIPLTATVRSTAWALGNNTDGDPIQIRYTGGRISNMKLNGNDVTVDTNTIVPVGTNTITYTDTVNGDRSITFSVATNGLDFVVAALKVVGVVKKSGSSGSTGSESLQSQQQSASNVVVNFQMNNVATQVFDHLGGSFAGGGTNLQVSANGFAASTTGFANMLNGYQAAKSHPLASLDGDVSTSGYATPAWNAWLKGAWNIYDGENFDGHSFDLMAGIDYRYSDSTIIGVLGGYGASDFDIVTSGTDGSFKGDGYSIGPYIGMKLSEHLQFDAMATYTYSDYASVSGTTDGNFNAHRATIAAQLTGTWNYDAFFVSPGIRFVYAQENQSGYTDSAGTTHSNLVIRAGRISIGPKIGYLHAYQSGGSFRPWLALNGEYDFSNQGADANSGLPDLSDVLSARFKAGFDATTASGISLSLQGNVSGIGNDQFSGYGGTARLRMPF